MPSPDEVIRLLRSQCSLYGQLQQVASKQRDLITGDKPAALLSVLADRKRIAGKLSDLGNRFEPVRRDWDSFKTGFNAEQKAEAEMLLSAISKCLRGVMESDEQDAKLLNARKQVMARELSSAHNTHTAMSAYQAPSVANHRPGSINEAS